MNKKGKQKMVNMVDVVELAQSLIAIPSYKEVGEKKITEFIIEFLSDHCQYLAVDKQPAWEKGDNLLVTDGFDPKVIFCCHMDTVAPSASHFANGKLTASRDRDNLYGLGSVDMKGGTAALLAMLANLPQNVRPNGLALLFYCDEETNFLGMKKFVANNDIRAEIAIFCEPTNLSIANGCRGLIEVEGIVEGSTAHAGRPDDGTNAILVATEAFAQLKKNISQYMQEALGGAVCNLAALDGGLNKSKEGSDILEIGRSGNRVADVAKVLLECRTTSVSLNAKSFLDIYQDIVSNLGGNFKSTGIVHDYGPFTSAREVLTKVESAVKKVCGDVHYANLGRLGYYDSQLFAKAFQIPCISLGPGPHETSHTKNEHVSIQSLLDIGNVYKEIIRTYEILC